MANIIKEWRRPPGARLLSDKLPIIGSVRASMISEISKIMPANDGGSPTMTTM